MVRLVSTPRRSKAKSPQAQTGKMHNCVYINYNYNYNNNMEKHIKQSAWRQIECALGYSEVCVKYHVYTPHTRCIESARFDSI